MARRNCQTKRSSSKFSQIVEDLYAKVRDLIGRRTSRAVLTAEVLDGANTTTERYSLAIKHRRNQKKIQDLICHRRSPKYYERQSSL